MIPGYFLVKKNVFGDNWGNLTVNLGEECWIWRGCSAALGEEGVTLATQAGVWGQTVMLCIIY